jgi:hypothetical protein
LLLGVPGLVEDAGEEGVQGGRDGFGQEGGAGDEEELGSDL